MIILMLLLACQNSAPQILAFNGFDVKRDVLGGQWIDHAFFFKPGEKIEIWVDAIDLDGDKIDIWFREAPPGLVFEHTNTSGFWEVPEDFFWTEWCFQVIVVDNAPNPQGDALEVWFMTWGTEK